MKEQNKPTNPIEFPTLTYNKHSGDPNGHEEGMTLRDYFANSVMNAILGNSSVKMTLGYNNKENNDNMAKNCYSIADSMLKQREL